MKTSPFSHPGIIQTQAQLDAMKRMIQTGQEPVATAWKRLMSLPASGLEFRPNAVAHVFRSAGGSSRSGADEFANSGRAAHSHALQWYVSREAKHAEKVIEIIDAWSTTLWDFSGNDAKLLAGWTGAYFCEAAEILRATYPTWDEEKRARFRQMLTGVLVPLLAPYFPEANGNWDGAIMFTVLSMAIYLDDLPLFNRALRHYLYGPNNAGILKYVWPSGQCQETGRDQNHVQLGLGYFSYAALVAWNQGIDLFGAGDNRLALGFEYTSKYMLGQDVPYFGVISTRERDRFTDYYEAAYQHYRFEKGIEMPFTAQAAEKARANASAISAVWLFRGGVANGNLAPNLKPDSRGVKVGAYDTEPLVQPGWHRVEPGEDIQAMLQGAADGSTILLAPGVHHLNSPLRLRSNITIIGYGRQSLLHLDPSGGEFAMVQGEPKLENIALRNFLIEGALTPDWPMDPNQLRRQNSSQMAPLRGGIMLNGNAEGDIRNVVLEHLSVRNCVSNGIVIAGAKGVSIIMCDVTDSGGNGPPGHGLNHNLLINHVEDCAITDCRLVFSLGGCGASIQNSSRVTITGCELSRNCGYGVQFLHCTQVKLQDSLLEANELGSYRAETDGHEAPLTVANLKQQLNGLEYS